MHLFFGSWRGVFILWVGKCLFWCEGELRVGSKLKAIFIFVCQLLFLLVRGHSDYFLADNLVRRYTNIASFVFHELAVCD